MFGTGVQIDLPYLLAIFGGAGGVIAFLFKALITSKEKELEAKEKELANVIREKDEVTKSYREIAEEAIRSAMDAANVKLKKEGKPPILAVAPVVAESHSPSTQKQREAAEIQTMRAEMASIKLALGQEPRKEARHATPEEEENIKGGLASNLGTMARAIILDRVDASEKAVLQKVEETKAAVEDLKDQVSETQQKEAEEAD